MNPRFFLFLVVLCVVNTVLFTIATISDIPIWKVVIGEAIIFALWIFIRALRSPAQKLGKQGMSMGWTFAGLVKSDSGLRDTLLERNGIVARISFEEKCVFIEKPAKEGPFRDFVEVERHLTSTGR